MTTNQNGSSPGRLLQKVQSALDGAQQVLPAGTALMINKQSVTQAQLVTQLSGYLPNLKAVSDAKAAYAQTVITRKADEQVVREFLAQLRLALVAYLGVGSPDLAKFGMSAKKRTPQNGQKSVLAAAKRSLTRQKRGTLGKTEKASIKAIGTPEVSLGASGVQIAPDPETQPAAAPVAASPAPVTPEPAGTPTAK